MEKTIRNTLSVCPVCMARVPARIVSRNDEYFIEKECAEHGFFSAVTWRGKPSLPEWTGTLPEMAADHNPECPYGCGLCPEHRQTTCCVLLEVTSRCNLACAHCFAGAASGVPNQQMDPPLEQVLQWVEDIGRNGRAFLQLSGGEPTLRDDLPEIVRHAKQAGCTYVQLNSNGLRLAHDEAYVQALAEAGLSFVFMQFDGVTDDVYQRLRGANLLKAKLQAIAMCGRYNIGVTLVPTVVPGVNEAQIGAILRLAVAQSPLVRGVHFQPVSYFGRFPHPPSDADRITLPEVLACIHAQAGDIVPAGSIARSRCDHARCGFHGAYIAMPEGLKPLTAQEASPCCGPTPAEKNREFVGSCWQRPKAGAGASATKLQMGSSCCEPKPLRMTASCCGPASKTQPLKGLAARKVASCCGSAPKVQRCCEPATQGQGSSDPAVPDIKTPNIKTLDGFLQRVATHSFTISAMAFQDAYTLDIERLRQCSLHVYDRGRIVPFCAYYLSGGAASR